jgi:hypothetical protein
MTPAKKFDRRDNLKPQPRPDWAAKMNELSAVLDPQSIVPITVKSLLAEATRNTGLSDFGDAEWRQHLSTLISSMNGESRLNVVGRLLTRAELLLYIQARLSINAQYSAHPEIEDQKIDKPIFITGYGRSGTTILFEILSQDPRFRSVRKSEAYFPVTPPKGQPDLRSANIAKVNEFIESLLPELGGMHKIGGDLPVEAVELEYMTFLSDIYPLIMNVPTYAQYLREHDLTSTFAWHKRLLKLLQWQDGPTHWLLKSPSHLPHMTKYQSVFPDLRVIFAHRDPLASADSVISFLGTMFWMRSDEIWGERFVDTWALAMGKERADVWDEIIERIKDGRLARGSYANFHYHKFVSDDPMSAIRDVYRDLEMDLPPETEERMRAYLANKTKGKFGKHLYELTAQNVIAAERPLYKKYQNFFSVPNEV